MALHPNNSRRAATAAIICAAVSLTIAVTAISAPSRAAAQEYGTIKDPGPHDRPQMVSFFTGFHLGHFSYYGFPLLLGGRYYIPIVPDGFLPTVNDEFALEFGFDLDVIFLSNSRKYYGDSVLVGFGVPADAVWDFHFSPKFDAYGKLGFVFGSVFSSGYDGFWWTFRTAVGMRLMLTPSLYFRAEVGYPAIMAGLGFAF